MKIIFFIFISLFFINKSIFSQNTLRKADDLGRLSICSYVKLDPDKFSIDAQDFLRDKLNQVVVSRSIGGVYGYTRFVLAASLQYSSKYILPGTPTRHSYEIQLTLYLGDGVEGRLFSTTNLVLTGIGTSQTKALQEAIKKINPQSDIFDNLIYKGKEKIIEYYNSICGAQIAEAESLSSTDHTVVALSKLSEIPDIARDCYNKSKEVSIRIYKRFKEKECATLINNAHNTWISNPNPDGGRQVAQILNNIDPESTCFKDAKNLLNKITLEIKQSNIELENFNRAYLLKEQKDQYELEKIRIKAIKDMVTSYYNSQPDTVVYYKNYNISPWYYY